MEQREAHDDVRRQEQEQDDAEPRRRRGRPETGLALCACVVCRRDVCGALGSVCASIHPPI